MLKRITTCLLLSGLLIITGCQSNQAEQNEENEEIVYVEEPSVYKKENKSASEIADNLANLAVRIPNVNDATALVAGDLALVGIDVDGDIDRTRVSSIKYSVAEVIQHDPYGANAVVVADPDLFARINDMAEEVQNGKPIQGFMDEIAAIVGRVMPEIPENRQNDKLPTETNENQLPEGEKEQLDELQQSQSKQHLNENEERK